MLSVLMILFGGVSVSGVNPHLAVSVVGWALAALLMVAGAALFLRLTATFYFALLVAMLVGLGGAAAALHHPELALPGPWALSVGVSLYLVVRMVVAKKRLVSRSVPIEKPPRETFV